MAEPLFQCCGQAVIDGTAVRVIGIHVAEGNDRAATGGAQRLGVITVFSGRGETEAESIGEMLRIGEAGSGDGGDGQ